MSPSTVSASHFPETKSSRMPASSISSVSGATEPVSMNEGPSTDSSMETAGAPEPERRFVWSRSFIADRPNSSTETVASFSDSYSSAEIVSARAATSPPTRRFLTPCYRHRRRCRRRYCCFRHCPRFHHSRHSRRRHRSRPQDHQFRYILRAPRAPRESCALHQPPPPVSCVVWFLVMIVPEYSSLIL